MAQEKKLLGEGQIANKPLKEEGHNVDDLAKRIEWLENELTALSRKVADMAAKSGVK